MHYQKNTSKKLAFSLLELSIALIIISTLMVAVIKGSELINQAKLASARQKTADSVVLKIDGLVLWFEPTLSDSFLNSEIIDGGAISTWIDSSGNNSLNKFTLTQATSTKQPLYSAKAINGIPALKFDGIDDYLENSAFNFPYNDYQMFVVFRSLNSSTPLDIMSADYSGGHGILLETQARGVLRTLHRFPYGTGGGDSFNSASGAFSIDNNYMLSYRRNSTSTPKNSTIRLNGSTTLSSTPTIASFDSSTLHLVVCSLMGSGRYFNGYIAEIIIYSRALSTQEEQDVEQYLSDKYQISIS